VFHDAFTEDWDTWKDLFQPDDVEKVAIDTHGYFAWNPNDTKIETYCNWYDDYAKKMENFTMEVWKGEYSLATTVCTTWLGGF
jgi:hypothetical protein